MSRTKLPQRRVTVRVTLDGRLVRPGGVAEVATELGVPATRVTTWISRGQTNDQGQPCPGVLLGPYAMGPVFDVDAWVRWRGLPLVTGKELDALAAQYAIEDGAVERAVVRTAGRDAAPVAVA